MACNLILLVSFKKREIWIQRKTHIEGDDVKKRRLYLQGRECLRLPEAKREAQNRFPSKPL